MVRQLFFSACEKYSGDQKLMDSLWKDIEARYNDAGRHYHTLAHLHTLSRELIPHSDAFRNWETVVFAMVFHDIVYDPLAGNNEEKSAGYAKEKLSLLSLPETMIRQCESMILATKRHERNNNNEINLFTDADLSVLGAEASAYLSYAVQIRKEYSFYPDRMYAKGRKKVLEHFLKMKTIFKTQSFHYKYEAQARKNIEHELQLISEGKFPVQGHQL